MHLVTAVTRHWVASDPEARTQKQERGLIVHSPIPLSGTPPPNEMVVAVTNPRGKIVPSPPGIGTQAKGGYKVEQVLEVKAGMFCHKVLGMFLCI